MIEDPSNTEALKRIKRTAENARDALKPPLPEPSSSEPKPHGELHRAISKVRDGGI